MKTALLAFTALLSVCGLAGAGLVRATEKGMAEDVWWTPMTNVVAMSQAFGEMYRLGEGGTEGYFKRVLESELSRPGGGDTNILALALDMLAWGCDPPATGALERALFDVRNPLRAETFLACVVAAQADQERLAAEVFKRTAPKERLEWYRQAVRMCPSIVTMPLTPEQELSGEPARRPNPLLETDGRGSVIRANHRLQFYFYVASTMEADAACAYFLDKGERGWKCRLTGDNDLWRDGVRKRLAARFMGEPGETGQYFTDVYKKIGDKDELMLTDIERWNERLHDEPAKRRWIETKFRLNFNLSEKDMIPAYKNALAKLLANMPDYFPPQGKRARLTTMINFAEGIGVPPSDIKALLDAAPDTFGVVYPFSDKSERKEDGQ